MLYCIFENVSFHTYLFDQDCMLHAEEGISDSSKWKYSCLAPWVRQILDNFKIEFYVNRQSNFASWFH